MIGPTTAACVFCFLIAIAVIFQLALSLGAPFGEMAMVGRFPGRFPPKMRVAAALQAVMLFLVTFVVLTRAGLAFGALLEFSKSAIWFVVAFCAVGTILNTITPSKKERLLWAPVTVVLLVCALVVAWS